MGNSCFTGVKDIPVVDKGNQALLVWDIENIRLPKEIAPLDVLLAIKQRFIDESGYTEHRSICCVTHLSLRAIEKQWPAFLSDVVPHMDVALAPAHRAKCDADYVLRKEMSRFCHTFASSARKMIVLLTGDADFIEPIQAARRSGCAVNIIYNATNASRLIKTTVGSCEWGTFLKEVNCGNDVTLPYDENENENVVVSASASASTSTPEKVVLVAAKEPVPAFKPEPSIMGKNATKKAARKAALKDKKIAMERDVVIRSHWIDVCDDDSSDSSEFEL
jgi:hypothetical protein